jgi:hypothetical protein
MSSTRALFLTLIFAAVAFTPYAGSEERPDKKKPDPNNPMVKKLAAAQKILGGLATNDFDTIKDNARILNDLSKQASWRLVETPRYETYSEEFQRITLKMAEQADNKNLDGVALSYVDMTLTCVKCHQHVRESKIGMSPPVHLPDAGIGR